MVKVLSWQCRSLAALASPGGLARLLAALHTLAERLSHSDTSGNAWCFRQPVPKSPIYLS